MEAAAGLALEVSPLSNRELLRRADVGNRLRRRRVRLAVAGLVTFVLAGILSTAAAVVFVFPKTDAPQGADAVLVLGPPTVQRLMMAQRLVDDGQAGQIVISVPADFESDSRHPRLRRLCSGDTNYQVLCATPDPFTTQGEARLARRLLTEEGWSSLAVVTSVTHISRARMLFDRCIDGDALAFVSDDRAYDLERWISEFVYQTGAYLKAFARPGC
jgi:uncharacterized SAM-binding protein YcdF (DUF218 family)